MFSSFDPLAALRALKGAPLSCLMAMAITRQPVTARWLAAVTGYGKNTITTAMATLEQFHFAVRDTNRSAWRLDEAAQMVLTFGGELMASPKNWDSIPSTATTAIEENSDLRCSSSNASPKNWDSHSGSDEQALSARLAALHHYGIRQPTAGQLAALEWCTPAYVAAMARQIKDRFSAGLLVHKIRMHDLAPDSFDPEANRQRYASWEKSSD